MYIITTSRRSRSTCVEDAGEEHVAFLPPLFGDIRVALLDEGGDALERLVHRQCLLDLGARDAVHVPELPDVQPS